MVGGVGIMCLELCTARDLGKEIANKQKGTDTKINGSP